MYDRNITIYGFPWSQFQKQLLSSLPSPYSELSENFYITSSLDEYVNISKSSVLIEESVWCIYCIHVMLNIWQGTHAQMVGLLYAFELEMAEEAGTAWYRSKETVPVFDAFVGGGFLSNKKWPLNEESKVLDMSPQKQKVVRNNIYFRF